MTQKKNLTVADVARYAGVSIRTLQYYDEIGLLVPARSAKDYRLYGETHLLRLQQILVERSLGRSLEDIRRSLDDPTFDQVANFQAQRRLMVERLSETHRIIASIDTALAHFNPQQGTERDMDLKSLFDGFDSTAYENEAKERWGETDSWSQSTKRTKRYDAAEWLQIKEEQATIWTEAAAAMEDGQHCDGDVARSLVERHRQFIDRWFYPLTPVTHVTLADMWEVDERFRENIDKFGAGLTTWIANAVRNTAN